MQSGIKFREIEHTADMGLEVWGESKPALFYHAAAGLYHLLFTDEIPAVTPAGIHTIRLKENGMEELLVQFLNEIIYTVQMKRQLCHVEPSLKIRKYGELWALEASCQIINLTSEQLTAMPEIKSVTYHQLQIVKKNEQFYTRIFFDI